MQSGTGTCYQALKMMLKGSQLNPDKCHLLIFGGNNTDVSVHIGEIMVTESVEEKLLGVTLDRNLDFKSHVNAMCKKAGHKLNAFARISSYMNVTKFRIMMNTFIMSQSYCRLIWMFHDRSVNKKMKKIYEGVLRIAYKDSCTSFEDVLKKAESISIHQRNLKLIATEVFKTQSNLNQNDVPYHLLSCRNTFAPDQTQKDIVLKVHVYLHLGYGMLRHLI